MVSQAHCRPQVSFLIVVASSCRLNSDGVMSINDTFDSIELMGSALVTKTWSGMYQIRRVSLLFLDLWVACILGDVGTNKTPRDWEKILHVCCDSPEAARQSKHLGVTLWNTRSVWSNLLVTLELQTLMRSNLILSSEILSRSLCINHRSSI